MNNDLISVIVPVYNVEKYLDSCIESIIKQTYNNLEIILVDDGSTDTSGKMCDLYANKDKRIKVIHKENGGLSDARNTALDVMAGRYVLFVDSDDYIKNNMIEVLYNNLITNNSDISICDFARVYEDNKTIYNHYPEKEFVTNDNSKFNDLYNEYHTVAVVQWNKLFKAEIFNDIRYPKGKIHEDEFVIVKEFYNAKTISYILEPLYYYRQRAGSIINTLNMKRFDVLDSIDERINFFNEVNLKDFEKKEKDKKFDTIINLTAKFYDSRSKIEKNSLKVINKKIKGTIKELIKEQTDIKIKLQLYMYIYFRRLAISIFYKKNLEQQRIRVEYLKETIKVKLLLLNKHRNKIFVFGSPYHSNMGDHAQTLCTIKWLKNNYNNTSIYVLNTLFCLKHDNYLLKEISKKIRKNDMVFLHSGYHTTDLYMLEEKMQRQVISLFPNNKIVILPQTILYMKKEEENKSMDIYNKHNNLIIMCRDEVSYMKAKELFYNCKLIKFPDIVTTLIGTKKFNFKRNGILMCLRNDKESLYNKEKLKEISEKMEKLGKISYTDTTINESIYKISKNRGKIINKIISDYAKYKVIITDRYHGVIFSLIANTPVLVISSTDHKVETGVKWFPKSFSNYIRYVDDINNLPKEVENVLNSEYNYELEQYFNNKYYNKLKDIIESYE